MKPNSRAVALDLLQEVLVRQRSLDEAMERNIHWHKLEPRDRAFARLLTSTTLRRLGELNQALDHVGPAGRDQPAPRPVRYRAVAAQGPGGIRCAASGCLPASFPRHAGPC